jgi:hypothetical protein
VRRYPLFDKLSIYRAGGGVNNIVMKKREVIEPMHPMMIAQMDAEKFIDKFP